MEPDPLDFALLSSVFGKKYKFDSGWQDEPIQTDMLTLSAAIQEALNWEDRSKTMDGRATIYHAPTGYCLDAREFRGAKNEAERMALAKCMVGTFYDMTRMRAYYAWESAGKPDGNQDVFWQQARQKLNSKNLIRKPD